LTTPETEKPSGISPAPTGKWPQWAAVLLPGLLLYFLPIAGIAPDQRRLLAVFVATVIALVAQPIPMGVSVLTAMMILAMTKVVPSNRILSGFSNQNVWLIFSAFLFARAVTLTGFGMRVAYLFVRKFGHSSLSLGYSIVASNLVLSPFVPSDTARGGAIIFPICRSLARALGSEPGPGGRSGSFLMLVGFHSTYATSAMFLTSMAANPLIADFALKIAHVEITWGRWALATLVPGLLTLAIVPYLLFRFYPPDVGEISGARALAAQELKTMGRVNRNERWLIVILLFVMAGWVFSPWHGIPNAFVALTGVCALLICRVITWADLLSERGAWDALIWFAALLMMADALTESGTIKIISTAAFASLQHWPWQYAIVGMGLLYLYSHYAFASLTAHVTALYPAFLAGTLATGAPPMLAALLSHSSRTSTPASPTTAPVRPLSSSVPAMSRRPGGGNLALSSRS
jgi:DASS family divalent anion:Na+ symporter